MELNAFLTLSFAANSSISTTDAWTALSILLNFFLLYLFSWDSVRPWSCQHSAHDEPLSCDPFWSPS